MKSLYDFPTVEEAAAKLAQVSAKETERTLLGWETEIEGFRFVGEGDNSGTWYWTREGEEVAIAATPFWMGRCALPIDMVDPDGNALYSERKKIPLNLTPEAYEEVIREFIEEKVNGA